MGVIVFFVIATFLPIWDRGSVDDEDLIPEPVSEVPAAENAYTVLGGESSRSEAELAALERANEVAGRLTVFDEYAVSDSPSHGTGEEPTPATFAEVQAVVRDTDTLAADVLTAAEYPHYQCPKELEADNEICDINYLRDLSVLTSVHAYYYAEIGQLERATEFALASIELGAQQITSRPLDTFDYVIGLWAYQRGLTTLHYMEDIHGAVVPDLSSFTISNDAEVETIQREYVAARSEVRSLQESSAPHWFGDVIRANRYWYQENRTIDQLASLAREQIKVTTTSCTDSVPANQLLTKIQSNYPEGVLDIIRPNVMGQMAVYTWTASLASQQRDRRCGINEQIRELSGSV